MTSPITESSINLLRGLFLRTLWMLRSPTATVAFYLSGTTTAIELNDVTPQL